MNLRNKLVWFHLSGDGREALRGLIPDKPSFEALVIREDEVGAWVMLGVGPPSSEAPSVPVTLIKWDYVASVTYEHLIGGAGLGVDESRLV
jgi:hypothetical protein